MDEQAEARSSQNGADSTEDDNVLEFLDSIDSYLLLIDSLSSTLRQGWLELAGARHSMGASRISSASLDHKCHPAATALEVNHGDAGSDMKSPQFTLCKWTFPGNKRSCSKEEKFEDELSENKSSSPWLQTSGGPQNSESQENTAESNRSESNGSPRKTDSVQKERARLLSMFGTLVSPKLRASQLSFETALETLIELANMRSSILDAYNQLKKEKKSTMG